MLASSSGAPRSQAWLVRPVETGGLRGGDCHSTAGFEAGFGDAEADTARATDDQNSGSGELGGVFFDVRH